MIAAAAFRRLDARRAEPAVDARGPLARPGGRVTPPATDAPGADPLAAFAEWRREAEGVLGDADAMALATATPRRPPERAHGAAARDHRRGGEVLHELRLAQGRRARDQPASGGRRGSTRCTAARCEWRGPSRLLRASESDAYFASRDRGHQLGARRVATVLGARGPRRRSSVPTPRPRRSFEGRDVERPARWGGYLLTASDVELWLQRDDRLHDRFAYRRAARRLGRGAPRALRPTRGRRRRRVASRRR